MVQDYTLSSLRPDRCGKPATVPDSEFSDGRGKVGTEAADTGRVRHVVFHEKQKY
jgi:hypothetical protein